MNGKGFAAIIIILTILIVSGALIFGAYYFSKIKNESAKLKSTQSVKSSQNEALVWKSYTSVNYGYSFKYPSTWQISEEPRGESLDTYKEIVTLYPPQVDLTEALKNPQEMLLAGAPSFSTSLRLSPLSSYPSGNESQSGVDFITDWKPVVVNGINGIYYKLHECAPQCSARTVLPLDPQTTVVISISDAAQEQGYTNIYNQIVSSFKVGSSICVSEQLAIKDLINNFENLQTKKDVLKILGLFTDPASDQEVESYNFLIGKDTGVVGLYNNVTTNFNEPSYVIGSVTPNKNGIGCTVAVDEQRSTYSNAGQIGYQQAETYQANLDLIKQQGIWKIDRYYPVGALTNQATVKYAAWGY